MAEKGKVLNISDKFRISNEIATKCSSDPFKKRKKDNKLTGEWIVFAKNLGINYYLCLATHNDDDNSIYNKIKHNCTQEFKFLDHLLSSQ